MSLRPGRLLVTTFCSLVLAVALPATASAIGELTQKPGVTGCISETGTTGACIDGAALDDVPSVAVSPDGASAYATSFNSGAVVVFDRAVDGTLTQKAGLAGCISETGSSGACTNGVALTGAASVVVSPDGASVYAASPGSGAVVVFDRAADGTLTQKAGVAGCISETGTAGACTDGVALDFAISVAVSPDGASVYVSAAFSGAVAVFDRAADGTLTQKAGVAGCISETGTAGACTDGVALDFTVSVAVSPDGTSVYAASQSSGAVVVFDRAADGTLTQKAGVAGCISETGTAGACTDGIALDGARSVAVSPDGVSVYVAAAFSDAVVVFDRAADGTLTQKAGVAGCISETGNAGACTDGVALDFAISVAVSPDGGSVYIASIESDAIVTFDRAVDGSLTQKAGVAGCISETGTAGACKDGIALDFPRSVTVSSDGKSVYATSGLSDAVVVIDRALPSADLGVTVTDSPDPALVGGDITYAVTVTNNGPDAATGVQVTDALPAGVTFKPAGTSAGCSHAGGTVSCALADITSGSSRAVNIVVTATRSGSTSNTVSVTGGRTDPVAANNSSTVATQVAKRSSTTTLNLSSTAAEEGSGVTFTASVTGGSSPTGMVTFRDGASTIATVALGADSTASTSTSTLAAGDHSITASYSGDGAHSASTSAAVTFTVQARASNPFALTNLTVFGSCISNTRRDIAVRYRLTSAARVIYTLQRRTSPRLRAQFRVCPQRMTGGTVRPTFSTIATRVRSLQGGSNSIRLSQFVRVANLSPGVYRLRIRAVRADGTPSRTVNIGFIVTAR